MDSEHRVCRLNYVHSERVCNHEHVLFFTTTSLAIMIILQLGTCAVPFHSTRDCDRVRVTCLLASLCVALCLRGLRSLTIDTVRDISCQHVYAVVQCFSTDKNELKTWHQCWLRFFGICGLLSRLRGAISDKTEVVPTYLAVLNFGKQDFSECSFVSSANFEPFGSHH